MNAIAPLLSPLVVSMCIETIAIALADEGVPVAAIARATKIPSGDIYEILRDAVGRGVIVEFPKSDWPPGAPRASRAPTLPPALRDDEQLRIAAMQAFRMTKLQGAVFCTILKRNTVTKQQLHQVIEQNRATPGRDETDEKMVDVIICLLRRKLRPHGILIETIWATGYTMAAGERDKAIAALNGVI